MEGGHGKGSLGKQPRPGRGPGPLHSPHPTCSHLLSLTWGLTGLRNLRGVTGPSFPGYFTKTVKCSRKLTHLPHFALLPLQCVRWLATRSHVLTYGVDTTGLPPATCACLSPQGPDIALCAWATACAHAWVRCPAQLDPGPLHLVPWMSVDAPPKAPTQVGGEFMGVWGPLPGSARTSPL